MGRAGIGGNPEVIEVETTEQAALGFRGSPSVAIDGVDVDARMVGEPGLHWG
ncbi:MAG: hypothetical protein IBX63_10025 [Coriobacteriia bacterium]|nr:hypothetical protein [Coriobacteriia bacterium]